MHWNRIKLIWIVLIIFSFGKNYASEDPKLKYILDKFDNYYHNHYQQKVYLHIDKENYLAGEMLWFSAYILNGITLEADEKSGILNIELINIADYVTHSQILKIKNGFGYGQIPLKDTIPDGVYLLRAYTNYMKNFTPDMAFNQVIRIYNDSINYRIYHKKLKRKIRKSDNEINVSFHPNNNKLVTGIENTCQFIVYNLPDYQGTNTASLYDKKNNLVETTNIVHGVGEFSFTPVAKSKYFMQVNDEKEKFDLPKTELTDYVLQYTQEKQNIRLAIQPSGNVQMKSNLYCIGHNNAHVFFSKIITKENIDSTIKIPAEDIPAGINKIVLFNGQYKILAEQCFFQNNTIDPIKIEQQKKNDSIYIDLTLPNTKNHLSVAVTNHQKPITKNITIASNTFLLSEPIGLQQKNRIHQSAYFHLNDFTQACCFNLQSDDDYWKAVFSDKDPFYKYSFEKSISIKGKILNEQLKYPISDAIVTATILNQYYDKLVTKSNKKGDFIFENVNYYDSIDVKLIARKDEKKNVYIKIDESDPYPVDYFPSLSNPVLNKFVKPGYFELNDIYAEEKDSTNTSKLYQRADNVIYIKDGDYYRNIFEALRGKVPGLVVNNNDILIRGRNTIYGSTDPLYLIDGVPTSKEAAGAMSMNDVDRIEVIKGSQSSMYGIRGANGVIAIYTKRGFHVKRGELSFQMLGYISPKKFKTSNISNQIYKKYQVAKTFYWNPEVKSVKKLHIALPANEENYTIRIEGMVKQHPYVDIQEINW